MGEQGEETNTDDKAGFTERAIMSLVLEAAEMKESAARFCVVVAALALTYGISTDM